MLSGRTVLVTGASRGIGKAIALKCAKGGANVVILAKTAEPHNKLPGTIYTVAQEVEQAGGHCLPCVVDIRFKDQIARAVTEAVAKFGGIDVLVNNASAIDLSSTADVSDEKYHLMMDINAKGTFFCVKYCLPLLKKSTNAHILNICPPLNRIRNHCYFARAMPYTVSKFCMTLYAYGLTEELRSDGIAVNGLWPKRPIWTAAVKFMKDGDMYRPHCRSVDIIADATLGILSRDARSYTGNFLEDEDFLRDEMGVTDFDQYVVTDASKL